ncbi:hypothetical protein MPRM_09420 [Mycobacterium parmense]|uniref:Uncharacterized protein n=1 Tax=Mycobacterium parmense TaxID=185642 RepID=A0A7I7YSF0_9MYCO|nr:hypothetical protein MPRM_09420 [Mycobacterium parmense]
MRGGRGKLAYCVNRQHADIGRRYGLPMAAAFKRPKRTTHLGSRHLDCCSTTFFEQTDAATLVVEAA